MAKSQFRSIRKVSGSKYKNVRKKRLCDLGGLPALTSIGKDRVKVKRVKGGNKKFQKLSCDFVFVNDNKKTVKLKIESVENNPANINFTRRNILTRGTIVKTEKGTVKITSRPGQTGLVYGVFVK
jgi:small subunit ribosomal protein S8e